MIGALSWSRTHIMYEGKRGHPYFIPSGPDVIYKSGEILTTHLASRLHVAPTSFEDAHIWWEVGIVPDYYWSHTVNKWAYTGRIHVVGPANVQVTEALSFVDGRANGKEFFDDKRSYKSWKDGILHSYDDEPAWTTSEGERFWYTDGLLHRDHDKPAHVTPHDFCKEWFLRGELHRDGDQPARVRGCEREWFSHGARHRAGNKPAVSRLFSEEWWEHGVCLRRHTHSESLLPVPGPRPSPGSASPKCTGYYFAKFREDQLYCLESVRRPAVRCAAMLPWLPHEPLPLTFGGYYTSDIGLSTVYKTPPRLPKLRMFEDVGDSGIFQAVLLEVEIMGDEWTNDDSRWSNSSLSRHTAKETHVKSNEIMMVMGLANARASNTLQYINGRAFGSMRWLRPHESDFEFEDEEDTGGGDGEQVQDKDGDKIWLFEDGDEEAAGVLRQNKGEEKGGEGQDQVKVKVKDKDKDKEENKEEDKVPDQIWLFEGELHRDNDLPAKITSETQFWYRHGKLHRDGDKPAQVWSGGFLGPAQFWYQEGELHRDHDRPAAVTDSCRAWHTRGKKHRDHERPAVIQDDGLRQWMKHGVKHRGDGKPAVIKPDGSRKWYVDGVRHRAGDKPAVVRANGVREWWWHGERHRDGDRPAVVSADTQEWYWHGKRHRQGGAPAVIRACGTVTGTEVTTSEPLAQEWWWQGERVQGGDEGCRIQEQNVDDLPPLELVT